MTTNEDIQIIAITRDLARRPDIAHLARILQGLTGRNDTDIPPIFIVQAKNLLDNSSKRELLITALNMFGK